MTVKKHARRIIELLHTENKVRVVFYLNNDLQKKLKWVCSEQQIRMSSVIEKLVENFLNDLGEDASAEEKTKSQEKDKRK